LQLVLTMIFLLFAEGPLFSNMVIGMCCCDVWYGEEGSEHVGINLSTVSSGSLPMWGQYSNYTACQTKRTPVTCSSNFSYS